MGDRDMSSFLSLFMSQCIETAPVEQHSIGVYCAAALLLQAGSSSSATAGRPQIGHSRPGVVLPAGASAAASSPPVSASQPRPVFILDLLLGWGGFMSAILSSVAAFIGQEVDAGRMGLYEVVREVDDGSSSSGAAASEKSSPGAISVVVGPPEASSGGAVRADPSKQALLQRCRRRKAAGVRPDGETRSAVELSQQQDEKGEFVSADLDYFDNVYPRARQLLYYAGFDRERWQINHAIYPKQQQFSTFTEFRWFAHRNPLQFPAFQGRADDEELVRHSEWRKILQKRGATDDFYLDYLWALYFPFSATNSSAAVLLNGADINSSLVDEEPLLVTKLAPSDFAYLLGREGAVLQDEPLRKSLPQERNEILKMLRESSGELAPGPEAVVDVHDERFASPGSAASPGRAGAVGGSAPVDSDEDGAAAGPLRSSRMIAGEDPQLLRAALMQEWLVGACPTPRLPGRFLKPVQAAMVFAEPFPQGVNERVAWPLYNYFGRLSADRDERGRALELLR